MGVGRGDGLPKQLDQPHQRQQRVTRRLLGTIVEESEELR